MTPEHPIPAELDHAHGLNGDRVLVPGYADGAPAIAEGTWRARDPLRRRMLALADAVAALAVAVSIALVGPAPAAAAAVLFVPVWILAAKLYGLYDRDHRALRHLSVDELPTVLVWSITCLAGLVLFLEATSLGALTAWSAVFALAVALVAAVLLRGLARIAWRRITPPERVVLVGSDRVRQAIRRKLELFSDIHASVVAEHTVVTPALLGEGRAWWSGVDRLVLSSQSIDERLIADLAAVCRRWRVKLSVVPPARSIVGRAEHLHHIADLPVIEFNTWDVSRSTLLLKRSLDVSVASVLLVVTAPLFVLTAAAIWLSRSGPMLYVQTRVGLGGRRFQMLKFRTMRTDAEEVLPTLVQIDALDEPVFKLPRDPRVTRLGRFLRRTSLDELPQLVNVLKGDMSLVGPRPEQVEIVRRYQPEHLFRLAVKPGLTGPMQVFGRGRLTFEERLAVERDYIENLSISRDLRILALTVPSVFEGRGAY